MGRFAGSNGNGGGNLPGGMQGLNMSGGLNPGPMFGGGIHGGYPMAFAGGGLFC